MNLRRQTEKEKRIAYFLKEYQKSRILFNVIPRLGQVKISIGKYSISNEIFLECPANTRHRYKIRIGSFVHIGRNVQFILAENHTPRMVSNQMNNLFIEGFGKITMDYNALYEERYGDITIGNDVWIGSNVTIKGGVKIGDGAVVGLSSFVNHDVAPYEIVGGIPAKHLSWRFAKKQISALERICWWDWDDEKIRQAEARFYNIGEFINKYKVV